MVLNKEAVKRDTVWTCMVLRSPPVSCVFVSLSNVIATLYKCTIFDPTETSVPTICDKQYQITRIWRLVRVSAARFALHLIAIP